MRAIWAEPTFRPTTENRITERRPLTLPALLTWKDQRGSARFASVVTRDVSEYGVFVETLSPISIPQFRLVQFQLDREARNAEDLPAALKQGRLLAAVYRIHQPTRPGTRQGLALRLMIDPKRRRTAIASDSDGLAAIHAALADPSLSDHALASSASVAL
ncbi:MAG: hypothetical protein AB7Q29_12235 [Vicinamibacterales bacterium]